MAVQPNHLIALFMIVVTLATGFVIRQQAHADDVKSNQTIVAGCVRNSARVAVSAAGWDNIARFRVRRGESPRSILAVSEATKRYVVLPKGITPKDKTAAFEVVTLRFPDGHSEIQPTAKALALISEGCRQAYPTP